MAGQIIAGGRYVSFYRYTDGTAPTLGVTLLYSFADQISTDVSISDTGIWTLTIDQIQDDETYNTMLETEKDFAIAGVEAISYENSTEQLAVSNQSLYAIIKGGLVAGGTSAGKQKVAVMACVLDLSSGAWKQEAKKYNRPKMIFKGLAVSGTVTIGATWFNSHMVIPAAKTQTTAQKYGRVFFG